MTGLLLGTDALKRQLAADDVLTRWLVDQGDVVLHATSVSLAILGAMAERLSDTMQRREWTERILQDMPARFQERLIGFEVRAARVFSGLAGCVHAGAVVAEGDLQVVAIGVAHGLTYVAPRRDWHEAIPKLRQHDPWKGMSYPT